MERAKQTAEAIELSCSRDAWSVHKAPRGDRRCAAKAPLFALRLPRRAAHNDPTLQKCVCDPSRFAWPLRKQRRKDIVMQRLTDALNFQTEALVLRAERQRLISSNIANADTPGYVARDMDFARALREATGQAAA